MMNFLVVEDENELRELVCEVLESYGYKAFQAAHGLEALDIVGKNKIDAIISDIRMPKMDGIELLKALRARNPDIPIIFMVSGYSNNTEEEVLKLGANAFYAKPYDALDLSTKIKELVLQMSA